MQLVYNQNFRWRDKLISMIFQQQIYYCNSKGVPATFDTPQVKNLLEKVEALDAILKQLDPPESQISPRSFSNSAEPLTALFNMHFTTLFLGQNHVNNQDYTFFPMNYLEDVPFFNTLTLQWLIINPNSKNRDAAVQFLNEIALNLSPAFKTTVFKGHSVPMENPDYARNTADDTAYLQLLQKSHADAPDSEKKDLQALIEDTQQRLEWQKKTFFAITAEQIDTFRAFAHTFMPTGNTYFLFNHSENLQLVYNRYTQRQMNTEQYILETERILKRIHSENK